jgi:hypothetical protein
MISVAVGFGRYSVFRNLSAVAVGLISAVLFFTLVRFNNVAAVFLVQ